MNKILAEQFVKRAVLSETNLRIAAFILSVSATYVNRTFILSVKHIQDVVKCSRSTAEKIRKDVLENPQFFPILRMKKGLPLIRIPKIKDEKLNLKLNITIKSLKETKRLIKSVLITFKVSTHNYLNTVQLRINDSTTLNKVKKLKKKYAGLNNLTEEISYQNLGDKISKSRPTAKRYIRNAIKFQLLVKYCSDRELLIEDCPLAMFHTAKETLSTIFYYKGNLYRQIPNLFSTLIKTTFLLKNNKTLKEHLGEYFAPQNWEKGVKIGIKVSENEERINETEGRVERIPVG